MSDLMRAETSSVVPVYTIDELVFLIRKQFDCVVTTQQKFFAARIEAGRLLLQLKARIDAGEVGELAVWWEWYDDNFHRSRRDAERVMALAAAEDPVAAHEAEKAATRERMQKLRIARATAHKGDVRRERPMLASAPEPEPLDQDDLIEQILMLFQRLTWAGRGRAMKRIAELYREWRRNPSRALQFVEAPSTTCAQCGVADGTNRISITDPAKQLTTVWLHRDCEVAFLGRLDTERQQASHV